MRPASIISLIISVLLIIAGLSTCIIAQNMANANGEALFSEQKSDGLVNSTDLTDIDISKIELVVDDAEINVYGKSKTSYIEFINFRENYYKLSIANKALSFKETPDMVSMLKFWENGFSFKGMRHIFHFRKDTDSRKVVNVYLGSDLNIKIFNISAENCILNLENLTSGSDYNLKINNGNITANTLKTSSAFKVEGENITLSINAAVIRTVDIKADNLNMKVDSFRVSGSAAIEANTGSIDLVSPYKITDLNMELASETGTIKINGANVTSPHQWSNGHDTDGLIKITTESADISIQQNSIGGGVTPTPEETTAESSEE